MKKSRLKLVIKKSMQEYYNHGLTLTAYYVREKLLKDIDIYYKKQHHKKDSKK